MGHRAETSRTPPLRAGRRAYLCGGCGPWWAAPPSRTSRPISAPNSATHALSCSRRSTAALTISAAAHDQPHQPSPPRPGRERFPSALRTLCSPLPIAPFPRPSDRPSEPALGDAKGTSRCRPSWSRSGGRNHPPPTGSPIPLPAVPVPDLCRTVPREGGRRGAPPGSPSRARGPCRYPRGPLAPPTRVRAVRSAPPPSARSGQPWWSCPAGRWSPGPGSPRPS